MATLKGVLSNPIPAYQNVPIQAYFYQPSVFVITAITLGISTTITTSIAHNYVVGQEIRLIIPPTFGCRQINDYKGYVLSIPSPTQVVVSINSSINVDPFIASSATSVAQILAIGDANSGQINSNGFNNVLTYIPGSFLNISPI
jgi:ABC-type Fe3+-hydroxamate transport system substrate-binding protein